MGDHGNDAETVEMRAFMSEQSLDEILGGDAPEPIAEEVAEPEGKDSRPRDEHGRFLPKQTGDDLEPEPQAPEPESVTPTQPEEQRVPIAALKDERQKRQELERQLGEVHNYLQQLQAQQQPQQAPTEVPDVFADPEGFQAFVVQQAVQQAIQAIQPEIHQTRVLTRAELAELAAEQKYPDYHETVEVFKEELVRNPYLLTQIQQARDPATFAYNAGKQIQQARALGSEAPPSREQIEAEVEARLREKIMAEIGMPSRPQAPSTLADSRSVGARSGPAWSGPKSLGDILG